MTTKVKISTLADVSTNKLLGRATAGTGAIEEITLGTGLSYSGTTLNGAFLSNSTTSTQDGYFTGVNLLESSGGTFYTRLINGSDLTANKSLTIIAGDANRTLTITGDASVSGTNTGDNAVNTLYSGLVTNATHTGDVTGATALTITNSAVTYAKMQNVSATSRVLGRITAGAGVVEELTGTNLMTIIGAATASVNGYMTSTYASKLDGITAGANVTTSNTATLTNKTLTGPRETRVAMGANDIDCLAGSVFTKTISGTTTLTVSNVAAAGYISSFILELTNGGSSTITWWSGIKWANGVVPTFTVSGTDLLGLYSRDGGTTWVGLILARDVR
jgi:hypothetical protein